jgi:hypothetical protein
MVISYGYCEVDIDKMRDIFDTGTRLLTGTLVPVSTRDPSTSRGKEVFDSLRRSGIASQDVADVLL